MRAFFLWPVGLLTLVVVTPQCGGTTFQGSDASTDGAGGSSGGSSSSGGSGSSGGSSGGSSSSGGGSGSSSGGVSDGGGAPCNPPCGPFRACCAGQCVDTYNDPYNCGGCGIQCTGAMSFCQGTCGSPPCSTGVNCGAGKGCCGDQCCDPSQLCCDEEGPVPKPNPTVCYTPTASNPTCPQDCAPQCRSDRNLKRDIEPVDERAVLESVGRMPVATWAYKSDPSVRHMGPMAQDFQAAFGLGNTDRAYDPIDAHGVAFAAIQGLYERVEEQDARIERLERENDALRKGPSCEP